MRSSLWFQLQQLLPLLLLLLLLDLGEGSETAL
jgi:hypothetical protein